MMASHLTVSETAKRMGVHRQTIYRLCWKRLLRFVKFGKSIRIPETAIEEYRKQFEIQPIYHEA